VVHVEILNLDIMPRLRKRMRAEDKFHSIFCKFRATKIYDSNKHKEKFYYLLRDTDEKGERTNYIHDSTNFKRNYQYKISKISIQLETPGILTSFFSVKKMQGHMDMESAHFSVIVSRHVEVSSRRQPKLIVSCPFDMDPTATAHRQTSNLTILGD
jgi:hypothetical protein